MSSTAGVAAVAIGLTLLAGFLAGQYEGLQDLAKLYQPRLHAISTMNDAQPGLSRSLQARGPLRELTPPWGDPAAKLRDEKSLPGGA